MAHACTSYCSPSKRSARSRSREASRAACSSSVRPSSCLANASTSSHSKTAQLPLPPLSDHAPTACSEWQRSRRFLLPSGLVQAPDTIQQESPEETRRTQKALRKSTGHFIWNPLLTTDSRSLPTMYHMSSASLISARNLIIFQWRRIRAKGPSQLAQAS